VDNQFILQYGNACDGYKRFFLSWIRHNNPDTCPTEKDWESWNDYEPEHDKLSMNQLLEIFPESIKTAKQKLKELKDRTYDIEAECNRYLEELLLFLKTSDPILLEFANDLAYTAMQDHEQEIKHWETIVKMDKFRRKPVEDGTITDTDIMRAKDLPIINLLKVNRAGFALCEFHSEKTPSCKVYKDNRFHCFSCNANGDAIDLVMKQNGLTFIEAVKKILNK